MTSIPVKLTKIAKSKYEVHNHYSIQALSDCAPDPLPRNPLSVDGDFGHCVCSVWGMSGPLSGEGL
jgi:hypothetical protein